jgi:predicted PurR-regulated permease PerM
MSKSGRKISGFLKAMLLAVVTFFVVFFFLPDTSERLFGVSIQSSPEVTKKAEELVEDAKDTVSETVTNVVKDTINKNL